MIVLENESYDGIIGNPDAPFLNGLASRYAPATDFIATTHPSLPNYLALIGGSTFGVHTTARSARWDAEEPGGSAGGQGNLFDDIVTNPDRCNKIVPFDQMADDIAAGTLPRFVWITPDLCQDMHDCPVASGDQFPAEQVPAILDQLGSNGVLFITRDEGDRTDTSSCCDLATGGHIVTLVVGPGVVPGTVVSTPLDHYSILQTIEDGFGLNRLHNARCVCTPSMGESFS